VTAVRISGDGPVLVVAAHPDDEILGCGGTMARHAAAGTAVHVLIVAEGGTSRDPRRDEVARTLELEALRHAAAEAARILGCRPPRFGGLPDNRLDGCDLLDVVKLIEDEVAAVAPSLVYTHHGGDLNIDHRIVHQAVATSCRPLPGAPVRAVRCFEVASSTEWSTPSTSLPFRADHFVTLDEACLNAKEAALAAYAAEMRAFPHPRSLEAVRHLAHWRGATVGVTAAEAFATLWERV
jgi:LmbE family N-acetylglucosaminyl deacetylase